MERVCGLEDSAEAEACSRVPLQWETDLVKSVFKCRCGPSGVGGGTDEGSSVQSPVPTQFPGHPPATTVSITETLASRPTRCRECLGLLQCSGMSQ